jgi:hypothetical protein
MGLTKNLLQIHDGGIGADAMDRLLLLEIHSLLEHLAVSAMGVMLVSHCSDIELDKLDKLEGCGEELLTSSAELS